MRICVGAGRGETGVWGRGMQEMEEWKGQLGNLWTSHMPPFSAMVATECKLKMGLNVGRLTSYRLSELKTINYVASLF